MNDKTLSTVTIGVTLAVMVFLGLCVALSNALFNYSKRRYIWVNRQRRFLFAISEDVKIVRGLVEQIKKKANEIGGSDLNNNLEGITQSLKGIDVQNWIKEANYVLMLAFPVVKKFEDLSDIRRVLNKLLADSINLLPTIDNAMDMKRTVKDIHEHAKNQQKLTGKLCELLEQTRERVRSLQDRPIGLTDSKFHGQIVPPNPAVVIALEKRMKLRQNSFRGKLGEEMRVAVIKIKLVHALVKDLREVKPESEIEKAWAEEAQGVIEKAECSIFPAFEAEERKVRWPVALGLRDWVAKRKIMKMIVYFERQYSDLLEAKARYGIRFLRRESKREVRRRLHRDTEDVPALIARVRRELYGKSQLNRNKVLKLCDVLESLHKVFREEKADEGAIYARGACLKLLKETVLEIESHDGAWETSEISRINTTVELLKSMVGVCSVKVVSDSCSAVGFDEDVHRLVSILVDLSNEAGSEDEPTVVSIVGTQGIGKTTLAKEVMIHSSIKAHFKTIRMVTFSKEDSDSDETPFLVSVSQKILETMPRMPSSGGGKDFWISEIRSFLTSQACLVVLDDLPSKKTWDTLKQAIPEESKSVVMVTTSSKEVSEHVKPVRTHQMRLRTEDESWELFKQMVKLPSDAKIESLAKRVVARTGGLPLAIMNLGYLLFGKDINEEELMKVFDRDHIVREQWNKTWNMNKDDFLTGSELEKCFSYSEFFPADFNIPRRRLMALWVASGSVQSDNAAKHLQELVDRNMIQVVERKRNGDIKTCRFPSTLKEIWVKDTRNRAARARSWSLFASFNRQLAYRFDDQSDSCAAHSVHGLNSNVVLQEERYPRSIMFFDTRDGNKPNEDIGNFLLKGIASSHRQFQELLVLDLEGVFRPQLPNSIGNLKKLTYLGLRWTFLEKLPDSIHKLSQLQTLDLKHTYVLTLNPSIWKLKALRHLYLSENCRIKSMPKLTSNSMKNLQTLSGVFLDHKGSALSSGLDKLQSLRKLGVTVSQFSLGKGISQLTQLRSLSLRSINENGKPQALDLESLSNLTSLTKLYLLGKLEKASILSDLPQSLTELALSASEISDDPVPMLAKLRGLKFLSLLSESYVGSHMRFDGENFPELLVLQIWCLPNLAKLEIELGALPKLREFEIRNCRKLSTTKGLTNLKTLQELKLTNMDHHVKAVEKEFAAAKENSSERIVHCPSLTKEMKALLQREA